MIGPIYSAYAEDGSGNLNNGVLGGSIVRRPAVLAAIPSLAAAGFSTLQTCQNIGCFRDVDTFKAYYSPLVEACVAAGIDLVPGTFAPQAITHLTGWAGVDRDNPASPAAYLDWRAWQVVADCARVAADGTRQLGAPCKEVYLDCEFVFFAKRSHPVLNVGANLRTIARHILNCAAACLDAGVRLVLYHPWLAQDSYGEQCRQMLALLGGEVGLWVPAPWSLKYSIDPRSVLSQHARLGSPHVAYCAKTNFVDGLSPSEFVDEMRRRGPAVSSRAIYFGRVELNGLAFPAGSLT